MYKVRLHYVSHLARRFAIVDDNIHLITFLISSREPTINCVAIEYFRNLPQKNRTNPLSRGNELLRNAICGRPPSQRISIYKLCNASGDVIVLDAITVRK